MLGRVATARSDYAEARTRLLQSMQMLWADDQFLELSALLIYFAELEAAEGRVALAYSYLSCVLRQDTVLPRDRMLAQTSADRLYPRLSAEERAASKVRGNLPVRDLIAKVLSGVVPPPKTA